MMKKMEALEKKNDELSQLVAKLVRQLESKQSAPLAENREEKDEEIKPKNGTKSIIEIEINAGQEDYDVAMAQPSSSSSLSSSSPLIKQAIKSRC